MNKLKPFVLLGPGDTIREELEYYGWEQAELAEILGFSPKHVSQLLNNKVPITFDTACQLSQVFKQSPQFWLNADARYRLALEECAPHKETAARALVYRYMPVRQLRRLKWLPQERERLVSAVKAFWGIETLSFDFLEERVQEQAACFRKTLGRDEFNPFYAQAWLRQARRLAEAEPAQAVYDETALRRVVERLSDYTTATDGLAAVLSDIAAAGVRVVVLPHLEKTYTDGASFWLGDSPVIAYTARFDRTDNFWFTLAHELGHILRHRGQNGGAFIDSLDHLDETNEREKEADAFARHCLKIGDILRMFARIERASRQRVLHCATVLGLHPGIVVGALQFAKKLSYASLNDLKQPVRHLLPA